MKIRASVVSLSFSFPYPPEDKKKGEKKSRRAVVVLLNPMRNKIEGKNRGEERTTLVTTTCPEAGKKILSTSEEKKNK